jgi:5-oxoprolinase (ATP-hydrolysing)
VLSSGALRGRVIGRKSPKDLLVSEQWSAPPDFIRGFEFHLLDRPDEVVKVARYEPNESLLVLEHAHPANAEGSTVFEVHAGREAPVLAAHLATGTPLTGKLPPMHVRLATTWGTNALLERKGAAVAFFVTRGFGDLLRIGNQQREKLYDLDVRKGEPQYTAVVEVPERIAADGSIIEALRPEAIEEAAARLLKEGVRVAAVALIHSWANPKHERELARFLLAKGFGHVSLSSQLAPFIKILPRAETTVVDAYLAEKVGGYIGRLKEMLGGSLLHVMTSAGGLVRPESFNAKDSLLSGPAGGVVGAAVSGRLSGFGRTIAFDMGGTSTDVSRFDGDYEYLFEYKVGEIRLAAPALAIESVAAGGGSVCWFDGSRLRVGPQSAGAGPGPACYGAGGPLTLTDVNLMLGRLDARRFGIPVDSGKAERLFEKLLDNVEAQTGTRPRREAALDGFVEIANERMADAISRISVRKGYDPKEYALVAFGGAGAQHACGVARRLGVETIVVPQDAALLSAVGIGSAVMERFVEKQILKPLDQFEEELESLLAQLARRAVEMVAREGVPESQIIVRRVMVNMRLAGQESSLSVDYDANAALADGFRETYTAVYGHFPAGRPIEVESIRLVASSEPEAAATAPRPVQVLKPRPRRHARAYLEGRWQRVPIYDREGLAPGTGIDGPALVFELHSVTVVEGDWRVQTDSVGALVIERRGKKTRQTEESRPEAVRLELFTNRFRAIVEEMGETLRRTALSTNVKERLDFSCALLDRDGELVANAHHIPVHLGAMGLCVRRLKDALPFEPGDVVITNHPAFGGTHLPDITVVTPVFAGDGEPLAFLASRAHHAEVGGTRPGSMPPLAQTLAEEGAVVPPTYLFRKGKARFDRIRGIFSEARYPSRAVGDNIADIEAAVAANRRGAQSLEELAQRHGAEAIRRYMEALKTHSEKKMREALRGIEDGEYRALERLDDGTPLSVNITISGESAEIDFEGCGPVHPGNLNATPAVVTSAAMYVLRLLVAEPLPLNDGLMRPVELRVPRGILNPDFGGDSDRAPAVAGGNVETSQRVVDVMLKALGLAACSQGTMNNVVFGNDALSYYETVCGGAGAGPGFDGASAVHTHMTNTRITDPEIIEYRYPVRLERFALRRGSGGKGQFKGGDGVVREILFLDKMSLSVLTQHRREGPYGLEGGGAGLPGAQRVLRASGEVTEIGPIEGAEVAAGDRLVVETPGGGGYGAPA